MLYRSLYLGLTFCQMTMVAVRRASGVCWRLPRGRTISNMLWLEA